MHPFGTAVANHDVRGAVELLAEDVVFRSPVVFTPYEGRGSVASILQAVATVFEDFRYVREIGDPGAANQALVFQARVGDRQLEGCDFLHLNDDGLIDELTVMIRPLSGAVAVADAMQALLSAEYPAGEPSAGGPLT